MASEDSLVNTQNQNQNSGINLEGGVCTYTQVSQARTGSWVSFGTLSWGYACCQWSLSLILQERWCTISTCQSAEYALGHTPGALERFQRSTSAGDMASAGSLQRTPQNLLRAPQATV